MSNEMNDWLAENESTRVFLKEELQSIIDRSKLSFAKEIFNKLVPYRKKLIESLEEWTPFNEEVKGLLISELEDVMSEVVWDNQEKIYNKLLVFQKNLEDLL